MNALISSLSVLNEDNFHEMRELLLSASNNGLEIINMVRKMRSLEEYGLHTEILDLRLAVNESCLLLQARLDKKNLQLRNELPAGLLVRAERVSLVNSVLNNLLTNALKFSYPGGVITIRSRRSQDKVHLEISDRGIGIPPVLLNDLFDIGKATSREGTSGEEGTGFGMPMVKKFMLAYGGDIEVLSKSERDSASDHGTTIILHFQAAEVQPHAPPHLP